jgi:hypothetical protein
MQSRVGLLKIVASGAASLVRLGAQAGLKINSGAPHVRARMVARAEDAPSIDALRGKLRGDANRTLDCAFARAW